MGSGERVLQSWSGSPPLLHSLFVLCVAAVLNRVSGMDEDGRLVLSPQFSKKAQGVPRFCSGNPQVTAPPLSSARAFVAESPR